jgi:hypothetical protein
MFAVVSWYLIEKQALKYKKASLKTIFQKKKIYVDNSINSNAN